MEIFNYREAGPLLSTAGQPTEPQLREIAEQHFEVVINLGLHNDPKYSLPDEAGLVQSLGMAYVHIPVDFAGPTETDLLAFFNAMKTSQEKKVLVHCAANKRVTAFVGLYRAIQQGWDRPSAFALMETVWQANPTWAAFIDAMLAKHAK